MSAYQFFKRVPVDPQSAQRLETTTIPAPTRGIILSENEAFMQPGAAMVCDNWKPTLRGLALRGGCIRWGDTGLGSPMISAFRYADGNNQRIYFGDATQLYDMTSGGSGTVIQAGQHSGNYSASQLSNQGGNFLIALNDAGDPPLRFDGASWEHLTPGYVPPAGKPSPITGPAGSTVVNGGNLTYVCKYRNRLFFIEGSSMNAWYLPLNAVGGALALIPLSGAATKGGKLLFCASWSIDAGDGIDDKLVFATDLGELLIFTGSDPSDANNWRQEGRYTISPPMGMNAHLPIGGDLLIATTSGIIPISAAITKDSEQLELAAVTLTIKPMWRDEAIAKRSWAWSMENWEVYGGVFVTWPGGTPGNRYCAVANAATGAWCRYVGWDATCFVKLRDDMFFGTQDGYVMQADRTGYDDGVPYVATLVGGWEMFQSPAQTITWDQARASFTVGTQQNFQPLLSACTDYVVNLPAAPPAPPDPGPLDLWDQGLWDVAKWDAPMPARPVVRNTMWVSIGMTGFSHAPVVMATVAQAAKPDVELIAISATFHRDGINV